MGIILPSVKAGGKVDSVTFSPGPLRLELPPGRSDDKSRGRSLGMMAITLAFFELCKRCNDDEVGYAGHEAR